MRRSGRDELSLSTLEYRQISTGLPPQDAGPQQVVTLDAGLVPEVVTDHSVCACVLLLTYSLGSCRGPEVTDVLTLDID